MGESISLALPASTSYPLSLACAHLTISKASNTVLYLFDYSSIVTSPSDSFLLSLSSTFKDPCNYTGPTLIIQTNHSIISQLISNLNSPLLRI